VVYLYDNQTKRRGYYGAPWKMASVPFHIWGDLVEKAGYKISDIPNTWTKFLDFFKPMQAKLQAAGMQHTYSYGWEVSTIGVDPINTLFAFMIAYGGRNLVTPDGRLHSKDPHVREALIKALERLSSDFKGGFVPKGVVNWNDADDNNAFHSKLCVVDFDGTLSTELAMIHDKAAYDAMLTHAIPNDDHGKPIPAQVFSGGLVIPKGAKNEQVAKEFIKYAIQPKVLSEYLQGGLGRWVIPMPAVAKNDPFWLKTTDPHRAAYFHETLVGPTFPIYEAYSPAIAEVNAEHLFQVAWADIVTGGMKPQDALQKAFTRAEQIFTKYPMAQG
jgi:multiple sugar transport system substrate-binding protein